MTKIRNARRTVSTPARPLSTVALTQIKGGGIIQESIQLPGYTVKSR